MSTRQEMISRIARETGLEKKAVARVIGLFINEIGNALLDHRGVQLRPLGILKVVRRKARTGRDLLTNEPMALPEKLSAVFKPSEDFREKLNK